MNQAGGLLTFFRSKIFLGLAAAVGVALALTIISMTLYVSSGVSRLDLSRPGFESARTKVKASAPIKSFDVNGPVNPAAIDEFMQLYQQATRDLKASSDFGDQNLEDDQLRLNPDTPPRPGP